jgi:hypothetical protein
MTRPDRPARDGVTAYVDGDLTLTQGAENLFRVLEACPTAADLDIAQELVAAASVLCETDDPDGISQERLRDLIRLVLSVERGFVGLRPQRRRA